MAVHIFDALPGQCRFPLWGPEKSAGDVCGAPAAEGRSYCSACHRLAYRPEKPRAPFVPRDPNVARAIRAVDMTPDVLAEIAA